MHVSRRKWLGCGMAALLAVFANLALAFLPASQEQKSPEVPVVNGGAGPCSADFVVTDSSGKRLYDAKIRIPLRHGFLGIRRLELEVGTNSEGKARFEGLPEKVKKPASFEVRHGDESKSVSYEPQRNCHPRHEITLGTE